MKFQKLIKEYSHGKNKMSLWEKIKGNHAAMMLICCGIPLLGIIIARYVFNYNSPYLIWIALAICMGSHFFMMKDMHHTNTGKEKDKNIKGDCH